MIAVPADWAAGVPTGNPLPSVLANGRLLRSPGNAVPIYVMENGAKRHVTSPDVFTQCGYGWDAVDVVSAANVNNIPSGPALSGPPCPRPFFANGTLLRSSDGKAWVVMWNARKWIVSPAASADCGYQWGNLNDLGDSIVAQLAISPGLTGCTVDGSLLWSMQTLDQNDLGLQSALNALKSYIESANFF